ncbi:MAG: hypothetical protein WEB37_02140 [Bacteroidota bacterium]
MTSKLFCIAVIGVVLLAGCSAASRLQSSLGYKYRYTYRLVSPSSGGKMIFQDDRIRIAFRIDDAAIRFQLRNRSSVPLRVKWDDVSIGVRDRYYAVRNTRTLYIPDYRDNAVPTILPSGYIVDMAMPAENVSFDGNEWKEKDLLPTTDRNSAVIRQRLLDNKGSTVNLLLPVQVGDSVWSYTFQFQVASVDSLGWNRYRKPRRPTPPMMPGKISAGSDDQIVTALVVAGLLGLGAILLTQKKSPPVE